MSTLSDVRILRTRAALREAMTALAEELPLEAITVRAIAARAGVGYATFFRHYADKDALLADVAEVLTRQFLDQVRPLLLAQDRRAAARSLCAFVDERRAIHTALIAGGSGETVRASMLRHTLKTVAQVRSRPAQGLMDDFLLTHLVSTILNQLAWWLRHRDAISVEAMAEILERTVLAPISDLRREPPKGV